MNTLSPFGKAIQLTKSICDPLFTTTNITTTNKSHSKNVYSFQRTEENIESDEDTPGLSQAEIDNTAEDRKNLIKARQDNFRLNAEVKFLKSLLDQKTRIIEAQATTLKTIQDELSRANQVLTHLSNN